MVGLEEDERMRKNQVTIFIERFGDSVPADYPCDVQRINVYCDDSTSIYAALAKAHALAVNELNEYEPIGIRSYVLTNEHSAIDYREMHGVNSKEKSNYDDDLELQFTYESGKLRKDRIWAYENFDEIMQVIRMNDDKKELKLRLKEKFGLEDIQVKKLLSMRLDMFTGQDYLADMEEQKNVQKGWEPKQMVQYYEKIIREAKKEIDEYRTYMIISENYQDMIELLAQNPDFTSYASLMREKYGFDGTQSRMVKLITVADIVSKGKYLEKIEKLEKDIAWYEDCIKEQKDVEE